ncbi:MAG: PIN domain-containing protein [Cyanobacteria bacterium P01_F01_bin.150]
MTICDTSPLIALINQRDTNHQRCVNTLPLLSLPLITTCECFTEAMHMLGKYGGWTAQQELWGYISEGILEIQHQTSADQARMKVLMAKYQNVPMDLADASLVALAETLGQSQVFTLDSDFYIYRLNDTDAFEVIP